MSLKDKQHWFCRNLHFWPIALKQSWSELYHHFNFTIRRIKELHWRCLSCYEQISKSLEIYLFQIFFFWHKRSIWGSAPWIKDKRSWNLEIFEIILTVRSKEIGSTYSSEKSKLSTKAEGRPSIPKLFSLLRVYFAILLFSFS